MLEVNRLCEAPQRGLGKRYSPWSGADGLRSACDNPQAWFWAVLVAQKRLRKLEHLDPSVLRFLECVWAVSERSEVKAPKINKVAGVRREFQITETGRVYDRGFFALQLKLSGKGLGDATAIGNDEPRA